MKVLSMLLVFSLLIATASSASAISPISKPTIVALNRIPSSVYFGEEVRVTGKLVDASGEGIVGATVKFIDNEPVGQKILASVVTRKYGLFTAGWTAALDDTRDRSIHLVVRYDGSANYTGSVSREQTIMVRPIPLELKFQYLKNVYSKDESAEIVFTVTSRRIPVEPDLIKASLDGVPVTVTAYGKGNYVFETPPLSKPWHQFYVSVSKHGYFPASQSITLHLK